MKTLKDAQAFKISSAATPRKPSDYMLCVVTEYGHRIIFSPDFGFHFTCPTEGDPHRWTMLTLMKAEKEIEMRLEDMRRNGITPPPPKKWRSEIQSPDRNRMSIKDAAKFLGVSQSTVRRLSDGVRPRNDVKSYAASGNPYWSILSQN